MAIVGFSFTKILAKKTAPLKGKVSITNNIMLSGIEDANLSMAKEKKGLRIKFSFESTYEPRIGLLHFEGEVITLEDAKKADEIMKDWEKKKSLPKEIVAPMLNHILEKSNIQALIMSRDLGLPSPIQLPKVNVKAPEKAKKSQKSR